MKKYIITEDQIRQLCIDSCQADYDILRSLPEVGEPVAHEFQARDEQWYSFMGQDHYDNTVIDGTYPIRALYTLENPK